MTITKELIDAYRKLLLDPKSYDLPFRPLKEQFEAAEVATPKHELYELFMCYFQGDLPKFIFYIVMDEIYEQEKAPGGLLGYKIKFVKP